MFKKIAMILAALGVAAGAYLRFIRPWQLRWGATDEATGHRQPRPDEPGIQDTQVEIRATP
jgi:hypothetical protein